MQDAQERGGRVEQRLLALREKGNASAARLRKAEDDVTRARRSQAVATIALAKAYDDVDRAQQKTSKSLGDTNREMHLLGTSIGLIGPSLVPIAGLAVAAAGAFGLLAGAGVLAVLGIKKEMQSGSKIGEQYAADIDALKHSLNTLEHTAASGFLGPFNAAVARSQVQLRQLNPEIHDFAAIAGNIGGHVLGGLIGGFHTLNPLFSQLAVMANRGADAFDRYANGGGLEKFQAFVLANLPKTIDTLDSVASAIGHIIASIGPLGGLSLTVLKTLADVINSMPVPVITALATAFIVLKTASTGLGVLSRVGANLGDISAKLEQRGITSAAGRFAAMGAGAGIFGAALFGLTQIMGQNAAKQQYINQLTQSYLQTLQETKGALTGATSAVILQQAAQSASLSTLSKLGISSTEWVNAVERGGPALTELGAKLRHAGAVGLLQVGVLHEQRDAFLAAQQQQQDYTDATTENNKALAQQNPALAKQAASLGLTITALQTAKDAADKKKLADEQATAALILAHPEYQQASKELGANADAYLHAKDAADQNAKAAQATTVQMQLENNAVGLLNAALDKLGNDNLGVAQSQTAVASSNKTAAKSFHDNGAAIKGNSTAAIANQQAVQSAASSAIAHGNAVAKQTGSTEKATAAIKRDKDALEDQLRSQHKLTPAVQAYIDKLYKIPPLKKTKVDFAADRALRDAKLLKEYLNSLKSKHLTIDVTQTVRTIGGTAFGGHAAFPQPHASGGQLGEGFNLINERGPELLFKRGTQVDVVTAPRTQNILSGANGGAALAGGLTNIQNIYPAQGMSELALAQKSAIQLDRALKSR